MRCADLLNEHLYMLFFVNCCFYSETTEITLALARLS